MTCEHLTFLILLLQNLHGYISVAIFCYYLTQKDDFPIFKPAYKALIGSVVIPTRETVVKEHNTRPMWISD